MIECKAWDHPKKEEEVVTAFFDGKKIGLLLGDKPQELKIHRKFDSENMNASLMCLAMETVRRRTNAAYRISQERRIARGLNFAEKMIQRARTALALRDMK